MNKGWLLLLLLLSIAHANNWPEYTGPRSAVISEAEPIGAQLMNFTVSDEDDDPLTVTINHNKQFLLTEVSHNYYTITLKERLDRETTTRYTIQITISDTTGTTSEDIRVRVNDVNDYTPVIKNLPLKAKVKENQPVGTFVIEITADDEDMGYNAATEIFLDDESVPFFLGNLETREPMEHSYGQATVLLARPLDFESESLYLVKVTVTDMAGCTGSSCQTPLTTTQTLVINVEDEQDTAPYFTGLPYFANAVENMPVGSPIHQVVAQDGDSSSPRDIEYYFVAENGEFVSEIDFFSLDSDSGLITNSEEIDTDSDDLQSHGSVYSLTVVAKEVLTDEEISDPTLDQSTTTVSVSIFDLNDEKPMFSSNHTAGSVGEELPVGSPVVLETPLKVTDRDQGINGTFTLRALNVDDSESQWFTVSPVRVVNIAVISLSTKQIIDFETTPSIVIKVEAKEQRSNHIAYTFITVSITDNNDNAPEFTQSSFTGRINENSNSGRLVIMETPINVTDIDSEMYGTISYSISGGSDVFAIDSTTGEVTVKCNDCLDRESQPEINLNILATDGGGLTDSAQLVVYVTDVNDNSPKFSAPVYNGVLNESSTRFQSEIIVQATDQDEDRNGEISFKVLNFTNNFDVFSNGTVYITTPVDAEAVARQIDVMISASDNGSPVLTSTCVLRLQITDLNDNRPRFTQTPPVLEVAENSDIDFVIYTVSSEDDDVSSPNNQIFYSLSNDFGHFSIDPENGQIKISNLLDKEGDADEYTLMVLASDRGQPVRVSQQTIAVKVTDVNDELPAFTQEIFRFAVNEGASTGEEVGTIQADDVDLTHDLSYGISQSTAYNSNGNIVDLDNELVALDSDSGTITVSAKLDRETVSKVLLTVTVEDLNGLTQQISTAVVEVTVTDINDNPPIIEPVGILQITENSTDNQVITQLIVSDDDQNSQLEFAISNNPEGAFSINNQGEIRLVQIVDRETTGNWMNLTVVVQDGVNDALSSSIEIPVRVKDVNDKAPRFTDFVPKIGIPEDKAIGSELAVVTATDDDFDPENKLIEYSIKSGSYGKIGIDSSRGLLTVTGELDVDLNAASSILSLVIEACDTGSPRLCTSRSMIINVTDINDNSPTFSKSTYMTNIYEIASKDDKVILEERDRIRAVDIDSAPNGGDVSYSCCSPSNDTNNLFTINDEGEIIVASNQGLRGYAGTYNLTVRATDGGAPPRIGTAAVIVLVRDFNDHSPELKISDNRSAIVHRPENSKRGQALIAIEATDGDMGDNSYVDLVFVTDDSDLDGYQYFLIERDSSDDNLFTIKQNITFDRETKGKQYKFGVVGKDRGRPQLSSDELTITVSVDDINDNKPFFPADKQEVEVRVKEEEMTLTIGTFDFAEDFDESQIYCYTIIGARSTMDSTLPFPEHSIRNLFHINSMTGEVTVADGRKLDRESQRTYILVIKADDSNFYNDCEGPINTPWTDRRTDDSEMELAIIVDDIDDNPPVFSQDQFILAVVRGATHPTTLINLRNHVSDLDEDQSFIFSRSRQFQYTPSKLHNSVKVSEPITVDKNGEVRTAMTFTEGMQGTLEFGANVTNELSELSAQTSIKVLIIDSENVFTITVAKGLSEVESSSKEVRRIFEKFANWSVSIIGIEENAEQSHYTDIQLFVLPDNIDSLLKSKEVLLHVQGNTDLTDALYKYGYIGIDAPVTSNSTDDEELPNSSRVIMIAIVVAVVLLAVMVTVLVLCYVMRNRYQRKLKAAHAMAFDTHTLGFEIDQGDVSQSVNNIPGSIKNSTPVPNQEWNKDSPMNNFDWGNANGAFDSESHRSSSHDDNAIDPLNGDETQSCSSGGSNDWRLDLRGNNLDCSPPPPVSDDVIHTGLNEHNNQLNYESKFVDSQSDHSSSTNKEDGHFNRLIMSDSVYGKIYETRRMPNGLETTEV